MHIANLKHACGHWQEWLMPCGWQTARRYGLLLVGEPCPRCAARAGAVTLGRDLMSDYHRMLCAHGDPPPQTVPLAPPPRRRRAA